jgi:hypothetical protein
MDQRKYQSFSLLQFYYLGPWRSSYIKQNQPWSLLSCMTNTISRMTTWSSIRLNVVFGQRFGMVGTWNDPKNNLYKSLYVKTRDGCPKDKWTEVRQEWITHPCLLTRVVDRLVGDSWLEVFKYLLWQWLWKPSEIEDAKKERVHLSPHTKPLIWGEKTNHDFWESLLLLQPVLSKRKEG